MLENDFASAVETDRTLAMFIANDGAVGANFRAAPAAAVKTGMIGKLMGRR